MNHKKELAAYVRNNVEFFEERLQLALNKMDRMRCPMRMADGILFDEICGAIDDWCYDNDVDGSDWDCEDMIGGDEGIIWEE